MIAVMRVGAMGNLLSKSFWGLHVEDAIFPLDLKIEFLGLLQIQWELKVAGKL